VEEVPKSSARLKHERAVKHIDELGSVLDHFKADKPYIVAPLFNPKTPEEIYYRLVDAKPVPDEVAIISGDIIQNLRSALDHLAGQLVYANGKTPDTNTAFPIYDTSKKYVLESPRKVSLMSDAAIKAIDRLEPYRGGLGHSLWVLHKLNNIDKHNLIITMLSSMGAVFTGTSIREFHRPVPVQVGDILFSTVKQEAQHDPKFLMGVAFGESGVCERQAVFEVVQGLANLVGNLLNDFDCLLG
jgi:hypothetical protein